MKKESNELAKYSKGDYVVYGTSGVCQIAGLTTPDFDNSSEDRKYYVLHSVKNDSGTFYIPEDKADIKIRSVMSKKEAEVLIEQMADITTLEVTNERGLENTYKQCMKTFDTVDWIKLLKCIYKRRQERLVQGKRTTAIDEKYMRLAEEAFYSEMSLALAIPRAQVEQIISSKIGK